jgi:hypothetical protein
VQHHELSEKHRSVQVSLLLDDPDQSLWLESILLTYVSRADFLDVRSQLGKTVKAKIKVVQLLFAWL